MSYYLREYEQPAPEIIGEWQIRDLINTVKGIDRNAYEELCWFFYAWKGEEFTYETEDLQELTILLTGIHIPDSNEGPCILLSMLINLLHLSQNNGWPIRIERDI